MAHCYRHWLDAMFPRIYLSVKYRNFSSSSSLFLGGVFLIKFEIKHFSLFHISSEPLFRISALLEYFFLTVLCQIPHVEWKETVPSFTQ